MENKTREKEYYTIDVLHILRTLWHRAWIVVLAGVLAAAIGFSISAFFIAPTYSSSIMLYVNNSSFSIGDTKLSLSTSQLAAAQNLVKTYSVILKNRTTLERVIDKTGVPYTYGQLNGMITAEPANETEIMKVTVTSTDPVEAAQIANCIAEILPIRVSEIVDGASMEVVDSAVPELNKVGPSITKYTAIGLFLGVFLAVAVIAVLAIMDDTIHDEDYILQNYDCPILAKVPNLVNSSGKRYGYYYQYRSRSKNKDKTTTPTQTKQ